jgi:hypothetical protein
MVWRGIYSGLLLGIATTLAITVSAQSGMGYLGALAFPVGFVMILAQKFSWWSYHMPLLVWPMGLLAAVGCTVPWAMARGERRLQHAALVIGVAGLALHAGYFADNLMRDHDWPYSAADRATLDTARKVAEDATLAFVTAVAIGDHNGRHSASGLKRAMATNAVFWGAFLDSQVERLPGELRLARPDLVFMDDDQRLDFARRYPEVLARIEAWLATDYVLRTTDTLNGRWWERTEAARSAPCPVRAPFTIPQ